MECIEIEVCSDCLMLLANGEVENPDPSFEPDNIKKNWPGHDIALGWGSDDEDTEPHFSGACNPCGACGSELGGDRHHATAIKWPMSIYAKRGIYHDAMSMVAYGMEHSRGKNAVAFEIGLAAFAVSRKLWMDCTTEMRAR